MSMCSKCNISYQRSRRRNPETILKIKAYDILRRKFPDRKEKLKQYLKTYREKFPSKLKCIKVVRLNLRKGKIKKQPCCECGNKKSQAHHEDYRKPLSVIWLCAKHHGIRHRKY